MNFLAYIWILLLMIGIYLLTSAWLNRPTKQIPRFKVGDKIAPPPSVGEFLTTKPNYHFTVKAIGKTCYLVSFESNKGFTINHNEELLFRDVEHYQRVNQ
jgi:hypothetical protein